MRKRIIDASTIQDSSTEESWIDLAGVADVELTSEDPDHPFEFALASGNECGWRAAAPGEQTIRLIFDTPQHLRRIFLEFADADTERTQQFVLWYASDAGSSREEILRQQWNFSPQGSTSEIEDYRVQIADVSMLALTITPDLAGGPARASLLQWRVG
jgi:hypothetical protein